MPGLNQVGIFLSALMSLIKQSFQAAITNQNIIMDVHPENTKPSPYVGLMLR